MKRAFAFLFCASLLAAVAGCAVGYAQVGSRAAGPEPGSSISVSYFYESLAPDGEWFRDPAYGWCWTPYDVSAEWRPYRNGHWEYTDYGWNWASDESWGWATYHYGRWFFDASYGWTWVPGSEWAPAWVAWRSGDDWVGWAPLPPAANWDAAAGLDLGSVNAIPADEWCFVPRQHVFDGTLRLQVTSVARNLTLLERSRDATRFEARGGRPANLGPDVAQIEHSIGRPVPRVRIVDVDGPGRAAHRPAGNGTLGVYRPEVRPMPAERAPEPPVVRRPSVVPIEVMQRQRDDLQRKLEHDLNAERTRLAREQENELRAQASGARAEELRRNLAAEQQAFEAHAARQRQVLAERLRRQVVKPGKAGRDASRAGQDQRRGRDSRDR